MPTDPTFWILVAVLIAAVLLFAIWRGNIKLGVRKGELSFSTADRQDPQASLAAGSKISVADHAEISGKVGRLTGETLGGNSSGGGEVSVANNAKISGRVDEITGRASGPNQPTKR